MIMKTFIVKNWSQYKSWTDFQLIFARANKLTKFGPVAIAAVSPVNVNAVKTSLQRQKIPFTGSAS